MPAPLTIILAALLALATAFGPAQAQPGPGGPPAVGVVQVAETEVTESSQFVGRIQSIDRVELTARVTAFIEERNFIEGTEVKQGDLLYRLERPPFEATVEQQAAEVARTTAVLNNAGLTLGRATALLNTPAGQRSTVDDARANQLSLAAQLMSAQAQLRQAQINLEYTEIRAPIAGKISATRLTVGNVVSPSSGPLATIVSQDPMYVLFPIAARTRIELDRKFREQGGLAAAKVRIVLQDGSTYPEAGKIDYVAPIVAVETDTIQVRARIANPARTAPKPGEATDRPLTDGQFVTVFVEGNQPAKALTVPRSAVLSNQQGSYVWVLGEGNKPEQRIITLGQSTPSLAVIASGLKEGETVIVEGLQRVRPGQPVAPAPASAAVPGQAAGPGMAANPGGR